MSSLYKDSSKHCSVLTHREAAGSYSLQEQTTPSSLLGRLTRGSQTGFVVRQGTDCCGVNGRSPGPARSSKARLGASEGTLNDCLVNFLVVGFCLLGSLGLRGHGPAGGGKAALRGREGTTLHGHLDPVAFLGVNLGCIVFGGLGVGSLVWGQPCCRLSCARESWCRLRCRLPFCLVVANRSAPLAEVSLGSSSPALLPAGGAPPAGLELLPDRRGLWRLYRGGCWRRAICEQVP
jgi:hypothetical protein